MSVEGTIQVRPSHAPAGLSSQVSFSKSFSKSPFRQCQEHGMQVRAYAGKMACTSFAVGPYHNKFDAHI
jgi:hypothetical protein